MSGNGHERKTQTNQANDNESQDKRKTHWIQYVVYFWCIRLSFVAFGSIFPLIMGIWTDLSFRSESNKCYELKMDTVQWSSSLFNDSTVQRLQNRRQPFLFTDIPVHPEAVLNSISSAIVDSLANYVKYSKTSQFTYYNQNKLWNSTYNISRSHIIQKYKIGDYSSLMNEQKNSSSSITSSITSSLSKYWQISIATATSTRHAWLQTLCLSFEDLLSKTSNLGEPKSLIWLGSTNSSVKFHYDMDDNLLHQVAGHKTVILAPPIFHEVLELYPSFHPNWRQGQLQFKDESIDDIQAAIKTWKAISKEPPYRHINRRKDFSKISTTKKLNKNKNLNIKNKNIKVVNDIEIEEFSDEVIDIPIWIVHLRPGDVLYIPPFFFHHVIAKQGSVSVNAWFASGVSKSYDKLIKKVEMPFEHRDSLEMKLSNLASCIRGVLKQFHDDIDHFGYVMNSRYKTLVGNDKDRIFSNRTSVNKQCRNNETKNSRNSPPHENETCLVGVGDDDDDTADSDPDLSTTLTAQTQTIPISVTPAGKCSMKKNKFSDATAKVGRCSSSVDGILRHARIYDASVRHILLMDYIEEVLEFILDKDLCTPFMLINFITTCIVREYES